MNEAEAKPAPAVGPISKDVQDALLFALWHHQGGSSPVGQPIRAMLGIGQHDHMAPEHYAGAKRVHEALEVAAKPDDKAQPVARDWVTIERFVASYVADYEMLGETADGRDACHTPSEDERALIMDAIAGLLAESDFLAMLDAAPQPPAEQGAELSDARLRWLHSPQSVSVDGYEWGIFRVKWENGCAVEVLQTFSDFSDLDAAIIAADRAARGGAA